MNIEGIIEKAVLIDENESVSKVISLLTNLAHHNAAIVVTRNGKYFGMLDNRMLRSFSDDPTRAKAGAIAMKTPTLALDSNLKEVVEKFKGSNCKSMPVLNQHSDVIGIITRLGAVALMLDSKWLDGIKVADVMQTSIIKFFEKEAISKVLKTFKEKNAFRAAVLNENKKLAGVVTSYDLTTKVRKANKESARDFNFFPVEKMKVEAEAIKSIMSINPVTVDERETLKNACKVLINSKLSGLVVTNKEEVVGVLSARDVLNLFKENEKMKVSISGLSKEQRIFKESLIQEADAFSCKLLKRVAVEPEDSLEAHVKTHTAAKGKQHRYEIHAYLKLANKLYTASNDATQNSKEAWDLNASFKQTLLELLIQVERKLKKPASIAKRNSDLKTKETQE